MNKRLAIILCVSGIVIVSALLVVLVLQIGGEVTEPTAAPEQHTTRAAELPEIVLQPSTTPTMLPSATVTQPPTRATVPTQGPQPDSSPVAPTVTSTRQPTAAPPSPTPQPPTTAPTLAPVEPGLIRHGGRTQPWVALTFDACQTADVEAGYDAEIIHVLTETHTAATLFLGGLWMQSHPDETRLLATIPYFELGNHSWSHVDFAVISAAEMSAEITRTQQIMYELVGRQPTLFRLPFGTYRDESLEIIAGHGLRTIQWDVVTGDPDPNILAEDIVRVVTNKAQNGSIVIMHMNTRGWHTAEALPDIIRELTKRGFQFVTVSQLLEGATDTGSQTEGNATIAGTVVNLRRAPQTMAEIVDTLESGDRITILCSVVGERVQGYETDVWYRLAYEDGEAYAFSPLVTPDGEVLACQD